MKKSRSRSAPFELPITGIASQPETTVIEICIIASYSSATSARSTTGNAAFTPIIGGCPSSSRRAVSTLYKVSVPGGAARKILHDIDSPAAISPDESRLAFIRRNSESKETALILTDIEGKNERTLAVRPSESGFTNGGVSWSPDGKSLSATVFQPENNRTSAQIAVVNAESGEQKIISHENWISAGQTVWLKDGSGILAVAYGAKSPSLNDELWIVSYPNGKSRLVTDGINGVYGISLNGATNSIVAVESNKFACFLTAPVNNLFKIRTF